MNPKLSIIIPVYNTEIYLKECLDSVINQTFKDIEIIIVNDCSPDNSETIILEYASKDPRIKYIKHDKNKSVFQARISGVNIATGDYILCIDSDDYLSTLKACQILSNTIDSTQAEVIQFEFQLDKNDTRDWFQPPISTKLLSNSDEISQLFFVDLIIGHTLCHRIIKKDLFIKSIKNIPQDLYLNIAEDFLQCCLIMELATSYISIKDKLYFYRVNLSSTTKAPLTLDQVSRYMTDFQTVLNISSKNFSPKHMSCIRKTIHLTQALPILNGVLVETPLSLKSILSIKKMISMLDFTHEDFYQHIVLFYIYTTEQINDDSILYIANLFQDIAKISDDKWYRFGQSSRKQKIKKIIIVISKKLRIYPILKYMYKIVRK